MADVGQDALEWFIPEGVPEGRCGFTVEYLNFPFLPGTVTCWRQSWDESDDRRCIWHADTAGKSAGNLAAARTDTWERLDGAILREADLRGTVSFASCSMVGADLADANLLEADFTDADLRVAVLTDAILMNADLTDALLAKANLTGAIFQSADLTNVDLINADLADVSLSRADLPDASLTGANLTDAFLGNADLTGANLGVADLTDALLENADLTDASFWNADITDADFSDTTARRSDFSGTTATNADFTDSDLFGAIFESAILRDSFLDGATLDWARLYDAKLRGASINNQTTFRDRTVYEQATEPVGEVPPPGTDSLPDQSYVGRLIVTAKREVRRFRAHYALDASAREETSDQLGKAISVYRTRQRLHRENSRPEDVEQPYVREKDCRRKRAFVEGQRGRWLRFAMQRWVMQYGESPARVIGTSIAVIVLFAGLYLLAGGIHVAPDDATHVWFDPANYVDVQSSTVETLAASLYFSAVTFSTLGYGGIQPATALTQLLASVQSLLGGILIALLVAVFARRALR